MIFVANLKCNHTRNSFKEYAETLDKNISENDIVLVFPPSVAFTEEKHRFIQGAQNFYPCENGSFTGEVGKEMLDEFGIITVLIGHSERRCIFNENEDLLKSKFEFAKKHNLNVIYCIGESEEIYNQGTTKDFLLKQLNNIDLTYENLIIAYEPIWAIGTGKVADSETIKDIFSFLSQKTEATLLYGGSVNTKNIKEIAKIDLCEGVLVGSASWDVNNFIEIIRSLD